MRNPMPRGLGKTFAIISSWGYAIRGIMGPVAALQGDRAGSLWPPAARG